MQDLLTDNLLPDNLLTEDLLIQSGLVLCMLNCGVKETVDNAEKLIRDNPSIGSSEIIQQLEWMIENNIFYNQCTEMLTIIKRV
jgi:hypothetical protein